MYSYLRLPFWAGVIATVGLYGVTQSGAIFVTGVLGDQWSSAFFATLPSTLAAIALLQLGARFTVSRIERLHSYSESLLDVDSRASLRHLYHFRELLLVFAVIAVMTNGPYILVGFPATYSLFQKIILNLPFQLYLLFYATFIWTWIYSMYSIYRMGTLRMKLKPFTEDRTLGLRPFGTTSLGLTAVYVGVLAVTTLPLILVGLIPPVEIMIISGFFLLAPVLFAIPLLPLRTKLLAKKRELSDLVGSRYTRAFARFEDVQDVGLHGNLSAELSSIDMIQRDIHQIHTWPLDTGILVRLIAIVLSVIAILTTKVISILVPGLR